MDINDLLRGENAFSAKFAECFNHTRKLESDFDNEVMNALIDSEYAFDLVYLRDDTWILDFRKRNMTYFMTTASIFDAFMKAYGIDKAGAAELFEEHILKDERYGLAFERFEFFRDQDEEASELLRTFMVD